MKPHEQFPLNRDMNPKKNDKKDKNKDTLRILQ